MYELAIDDPKLKDIYRACVTLKIQCESIQEMNYKLQQNCEAVLDHTQTCKEIESSIYCKECNTNVYNESPSQYPICGDLRPISDEKANPDPLSTTICTGEAESIDERRRIANTHHAVLKAQEKAICKRNDDLSFNHDLIMEHLKKCQEYISTLRSNTMYCPFCKTQLDFK
jgi:hypothetical protein